MFLVIIIGFEEARTAVILRSILRVFQNFPSRKCTLIHLICSIVTETEK